MAFLPEWVCDGGRSGSRGAFGAAQLKPYMQYVTMTPSRRNDDYPQIQWVKLQLQMGGDCFLLTNDNFIDHIKAGLITQSWFDAHVLSYMWVGRTNTLLVNPPHSRAADLPGVVAE